MLQYLSSGLWHLWKHNPEKKNLVSNMNVMKNMWISYATWTRNKNKKMTLDIPKWVYIRQMNGNTLTEACRKKYSVHTYLLFSSLSFHFHLATSKNYCFSLCFLVDDQDFKSRDVYIFRPIIPFKPIKNYSFISLGCRHHYTSASPKRK